MQLFIAVGQAISLRDESYLPADDIHPRGGDDALAAELVEVVPGVHHASITRLRTDVFQTLAPTHAVATGADLLQYELNSGPCVDSVRTDGPLLATDLAHDRRWPV